MRDFVSRQPGWRIVREFEDQKSAATMNRPGLQDLFAAAERDEFDVVLFRAVDRLVRSTRDLWPIVDRLADAGVAVKSVTQDIDTTTPSGRAMLNMAATFAALEREQIIERITYGIEAKANQGLWIGGPPPFGYDKDSATHGLIPNEDEAAIVRLIFECYVREGLSGKKIAERLNERGHRSSTGKLWTYKLVGDIIRRPVYAGMIDHSP